MPPKRARNTASTNPPTRSAPKRAASSSTPTSAPAPSSKRTSARTYTRNTSRTTNAKATPNPANPNRAQNDTEILTSFRLFCLSRDAVSDPDALSSAGSDDDDNDNDGDIEGASNEVIKIADVRRALNACNLPKPPPDFFEEEQRYLSWRHFLELARTLREMQDDENESEVEDDEGERNEEVEGDGDEDGDDGGGFVPDEEPGGFERDSRADDDDHEEEEADEEDDEEDAGGFARPKSKPKSRKPAASTKSSTKASSKTATKKTTSKSKSKSKVTSQSEIDHAFALFTHSTPTVQRSTITLQDLRRIAHELREEVDDRILMLMIEEANGVPGRESVGRGVGRADFEAVMKRAGVFAVDE